MSETPRRTVGTARAVGGARVTPSVVGRGAMKVPRVGPIRGELIKNRPRSAITAGFADVSGPDGAHQGVARDHGAGFGVRFRHGTADLAEVVGQRGADRLPAVLAEPLGGRRMPLVVDQLEERAPV